MEPADFQQFYGILPEPMLFLTEEGEVLTANAAATDLLGRELPELAGTRLHELTAETEQKLRRYLVLWRRSTQFVPGALLVQCYDGATVRCRAEGAALRSKIDTVPVRLLLRLLPEQSTTSRFLALNERVEALKEEIAVRQRVQAELYREREMVAYHHGEHW